MAKKRSLEDMVKKIAKTPLDSPKKNGFISRTRNKFLVGVLALGIGVGSYGLYFNFDNAVGWNNKGTILDYYGLYEEALTAYNKALLLDNKYVVALTNKGVTLSNLGRVDEAIECYATALHINPFYKLARDNRDSLLKKMNAGK